jgi:hypothetical protein
MYCGINCNNSLKIAVTSGFGSLATYGPVETGYTSHRYFGLAYAARTSKNQPSSNLPFQCAICDNIFCSVKSENLALIYKKCRGEGVKSEKSRKKTYFQCEV